MPPKIDPRYAIPRDLEGYGEEAFDPQWPNQAVIALSFILNYEEGAERTILNGDTQSEPYLWEKGASSTYLSNARHLTAESEFEYGSRVGSWRILRLFADFGYKFTVWACSQALARNRKFAAALVRDGHEVAAHGKRWLDIGEMEVREEREYIRENLRELREITGDGRWVRGFFYGRGTGNTRGLFGEVLREEGGELLYCSEAFNDDLPYWVDLPYEASLPVPDRKGMLIVPYNYDCNDGKFHMSPGFVGSTMYLEYLKSTFDALYREGLNGRPGIMNVPLHTRIIGKPGRTEALRAFMEYVKEKEGVWVARREEIAGHFRERFPYEPGYLATGRKRGV